MAPLVNPAVCATSSSDPSSIPRSAKTCSPASTSSDLVSALRLARMIPMSIYDTDQHPNCNRPAQDGTFRYQTVSQSTDYGVPTPLWGGVTPLIARRVSGAKDWAAPHPLPCQEQACERRANRSPERRKSAVRACRARHRSDRGRLRRVQAADHDVVLRDQRSRHVSAVPQPDYGRAGPRNLGYSVRKGTGARAAGGGRGRGNLLRRRGGWRYQALAMSLTYSAIVVTYIPQIIKAVTERRASVINEGAPTADSVRAAPKQVGVGGALLGLGALFLLAAALPILAGIGNIIGLFIIGIALYEAWRLNKAIPLRITGPYQVSAPPAAPA